MTRYSEFSRFLTQAVPSLTPEQLRACALDLVDLGAHDDIFSDDTVWREWLRRLGGVGNVTNYANTLLTGERSRGE